MKKLVTIAIAVMMLVFSMTSAFALSVDSPVATTMSDDDAEHGDRDRGDGSTDMNRTDEDNNNVNKPDNSSTSPQTGSNDILAYSLIALSVIGCGAASAALIKSAKKN